MATASAGQVPTLKWLVFGCGGVGGYFGARLAAQGQKVSFMVRNQTLAALKRGGVRVQSICGDVNVPRDKLDQLVDTSASNQENVFEADVIMLACKAWELERCLKMCEPWCGKDTLVLPLQNGVEGLSKVKSVVAQWGKGHALAGCCNIVAAIQEPGLIRHWAADPPYITFGEFSGQPVGKTLQAKAVFDACSGMEGHLEEDALSAIWEKFAFICSTTGVQSTSGPSATQDLIPQVPELEAMWRSAMKEIIALARSCGIRYDDAWLENRVEVLRKAKGATTSCSRDLWAGRASELDDLLGSVVRMGNEQGVPTPVISTCFRAMIVRDRVARADVDLPIYPLLEGQKVLGTICNHKGQQLPADRTLVQKKAEEYSRPEWFICPMSSCTASGSNCEVPPGNQMLWEAELGVVISRSCENVPVSQAMDYVGGYCVVLDMTAGNMGFESMKYGHSWTRNKCQSTFKPVGKFIPKSAVQNPEAVTVVCKVNGKTVANDSTSKMKFSIAEQVADASALTPLRRGDVLLAGAGSLGGLNVGDFVEGMLEGFDPQYAVNARLTPPRMISKL